MDKQFGVSFLTSDKKSLPGHKLRIDCYKRMPNRVGDIPVIKYMSPPRIPDKHVFLAPWEYSIVPENASHNNWFADKIIDCFLAKAIPFYWGCPNLGNFFNTDGVFWFQNFEHLIQRIKGLTPGLYESMLPVVEDNYNRALKYVPIWGRIEQEINKLIERKPSVTTIPLQKPILFLSTCMGDMHPSIFSPPIKTWPYSISITFDNGSSAEDKSEYKIHVQCEPPDVINAVDLIIRNHTKYDLLLAWNEKILSSCSNAILFPHTETVGPSIGGLMADYMAKIKY